MKFIIANNLQLMKSKFTKNGSDYEQGQVNQVRV